MASELSTEFVRLCYNLPQKLVAHASVVPVHACDFYLVKFFSHSAQRAAAVVKEGSPGNFIGIRQQSF
jgi:hypothetical protein